MQRYLGKSFLLLLGAMAPMALIRPVHAQTHAFIAWERQSFDKVSLWKLNGSGGFTYTDFGPYGTWKPRAGTRDPNGNGGLRVIWWDGVFSYSLWNSDANGNMTGFYDFKLFGDWRPRGMSAAGGYLFILWQNNTTQQVSLWKMSDSNHTFTFWDYGPFPGWEASDVSATDANHVHILWENFGAQNTGQVSLWNVDLTNTSNTNYTSTNYGPFAGWNVQGMDENGGTLSILWQNNNPTANTENISVWKIVNNGAPTSWDFPTLTADWQAGNISTGSDGTLVLWKNTNGQASLWSVTGNQTYTSLGTWGPFADWRVDAVLDN